MNNDLKERIRSMNIVRNTLKANLYCIPWYSREKANELITEIDNELLYFQQQKRKKDSTSINDKQLKYNFYDLSNYDFRY